MTARARRWRLSILGLLVALLAFELYARFPASSSVAPLSVPRDTEELVLVFHGTGGAREPVLLALTERVRALGLGRARRFVSHHVWSPRSDNIFRAAAEGQDLGRSLGAQLAGLPALRSIWLIAHSAGAYVLDPLCEAYRARASRAAHLEMTLLDPIGTMGTWDYGYGYRNHGRCADFASAYLNLDDPVPGTNAPAQRAYNIDVTQAQGRRAFAGDSHAWPIRYFLDHVDAPHATPGLRSHTRLPRGRVVTP